MNVLEKFSRRLIQAYVAVFTPMIAAPKLAIQKVYYNYGVKFGPETEQDVIDRAVSMARDLLKLREGYKLSVYKDSRGFDTVGIGHLVTSGDNLKFGDTISAERAENFFNSDIQKATETAVRDVKELNMFTDDFLGAWISVSFQLGDFRGKGFANTFNRLKDRRFNEAIAALKQSAWYSQTPTRVNDLIAAIQRYQNKFGVNV